MGWGWVESAARPMLTTVVAGIGAAAGFTHTHAWAAANGQGGWLAWADAVVIECTAVVAGTRLRDADGKIRRFPVAVMVCSVALQLTAQVALAPQTLFGWIAAAVPALAFLVCAALVLHGPTSSRRVAGPEVPVSDTPPPPPAHVDAVRESVPEIGPVEPESVVEGEQRPGRLDVQTSEVSRSSVSAGQQVSSVGPVAVWPPR